MWLHKLSESDKPANTQKYNKTLQKRKKIKWGKY